MDATGLSKDEQLKQLRERVAELEEQVNNNPTTVSRRSVIGGSTAVGLAALFGFGSQSASAQTAAGQVGSSSNRLDLYGATLDTVAATVTQSPTNNSDVVRLTDLEPYLKDGDGVEREIYLISNGASDPASADADDLIFEADQ